MRAATRLVPVLVLLLAGAARGDSDYDNFMSSLSYNWQNEFPDLRYQLDDMQRNEPEQYSALAASMGLKPGAKLSVPSEYTPEWASRFVAAAHLYTPPAPSAEDTEAPTPTAAHDDSKESSAAESGHHATSNSKASAASHGNDSSTSDASDDLDSVDGSSSSKSKSKSSQASKSKTPSDSSDNGDQASDDDDAGSAQFGNPVVGGMSNGPIVPSGQGYSAATPAQNPSGPVAATLVLALWLLSRN